MRPLPAALGRWFRCAGPVAAERDCCDLAQVPDTEAFAVRERIYDKSVESCPHAAGLRVRIEAQIVTVEMSRSRSRC